MSLEILIFDDIQKNRLEVVACIQSALGARGRAKEFVQGTHLSGVHEEKLVLDLRLEANQPIDLIVADRDLSSYSAEYRGLSESSVRHAADKLGIPECGYARGERVDDSEYIHRGEIRESCIRLSRKPSDEDFAQRVVAIAEGFRDVLQKVESFGPKQRWKTPGHLLAAILGKPEYAEKIAQFASGDQQRLGAVESVTKESDDKVRTKRLACVMGYWLWDSVLRFPGVVVNQVAASSLVNIHEEDFCNPGVKELFAEARYSGPFHAATLTDLWWRGALEDILAEAEAIDGKDLARRHGLEVRNSVCCEDANLKAGYYCFLSGRPVSLKNSKPGLPWFPREADLARVCTTRYEEDVPWL